MTWYDTSLMFPWLCLRVKSCEWITTCTCEYHMKRHSWKKPIKSKKHSSVYFEIEEDAEELLRSHLEEYMPPDKDGSKLEPAAQKNKAKPKAKAARKRPPLRKIDLHGQTLIEAQNTIDQLFTELLHGRLAQRIEVQVITGKGLHSGPSGAVLAKHIHNYIVQRYQMSIESIEDSPDDLRLNGIPIRGHFNVILKP